MLAQQVTIWGCLLAMCTSARAQDDVDKYVGQYFDRSIVRNEIRNISIVYGEHESSRFFLRDDASGFIHGGCMKFPLSRGLSVNDFVIHDGNVYFCGSKDDTTAIVGWYNIQGVFENNVANYTLCEVPHHINSYYWYQGLDDLQEFTRINVVDCPNGLHILMLGRGKCTQDGTGIL